MFDTVMSLSDITSKRQVILNYLQKFKITSRLNELSLIFTELLSNQIKHRADNNNIITYIVNIIKNKSEITTTELLFYGAKRYYSYEKRELSEVTTYNGRGLQIVNQLCFAWGIINLRCGEIITWCNISLL